MNNTRFLKTKAEVIAIPVPEETSTYKPVSYKELIDLTLAALEKNGLSVREEKYSTTATGQVCTAEYDIDYGDDRELGLRIAWQNSYNKTVSLKFAIGARVFVCSNGACFGDIASFKRKHVGEVQTITPQIIEEYIGTAGTVYDKLVDVKEKMKGVIVGHPTVAKVVGELYLGDILTETQIAIVKREIKKPSCNYNAPNTAWELYNNITFALKGAHPSKYIEMHTRVHKYFMTEFELWEPDEDPIIDDEDLVKKDDETFPH